MEKKLLIAFFSFLVAGFGLMGVKYVGNVLVSADTTSAQQSSDSTLMIVLVVVAVLIFLGGGLIAVRGWLHKHRHN